MRAFRDVGVNFVLQHMVKMSEGLLLGKNGDVELSGVVDQSVDFLRRERGFFGGEQRLAGEIEHVLHVKSEQIHLVGRQRADLALHVVFGGNGAAADVILHTAPLHAWPVANGNRRAD